MAERLIQIIVPADHADRLQEVINQAEGAATWQDASDEVRLFAVQVSAEKVESVLDPVEAAMAAVKGFRALVLPVEASLPRPEEAEKEAACESESESDKKPEHTPSRVSREEIYADLSEVARGNRVFLAMVVLSTVVAAIGLVRSNAAVVIGAMVMAPLLGPNMALSLATTLGDTKLAVEALRTTTIGVVVTVAVAVACGFILPIDLDSAEIASRTVVEPTDIALALAAGIAGALAFTSGVPASLVGVMVAVALLPPLVTCAMLLGNGHLTESLGALLLLGCNVISVNLAGVATFLIQGVSPRKWWDAERSKRMARRALALWIALLLVVTVLIVLAGLAH